MSARLSPAANLLRNSKLFALPPAIALPTPPPSSDQVASSDTATTVYPRYAAIETTTLSGSVGDWGFKRPLPLKTTKTTNNPVVRLIRGIDTPEHVADFESAADHVLTLRKFQALNVPIRLQSKNKSAGFTSGASTQDSVFSDTHDNITSSPSTTTSHRAASTEPGRSTGVWPEISSESVSSQLPDKLQQIERQVREEERARLDEFDTSGQKALEATASTRQFRQYRRWRYSGPSLVQMSGMEFNDYLNSLGTRQKKRLEDRVKEKLVQRRTERARDSGNMQQEINVQSITDEEVTQYMRRLRNSPREFGPLLAEVLDLPEGPQVAAQHGKEPWQYGPTTLATTAWTQRGPPRTHPSAGLSYLKSSAAAENHPIYGPQKASSPVVARAVKTRSRIAGGNDVDYGVAGFIVPKPGADSTKSSDGFVPRPGGTKILVRPQDAYVTENGMLNLNTTRVTGYAIKDDKPVDERELHQISAKDVSRQAGSAPQLSNSSSGYQPRPPRRASMQQSSEHADLEKILNMRPTRTV